ncbi:MULTISPECIES: hypothetical protein [unclassified Sphingomonas]|uniref:hypothetical protein n=1 Tax=unclassified Sphingomonas TaxID=196159 RepID=UPI000701AD02|nr:MULTISPECIES: hypothetical protein [unclassified Sphingomonas]KQX23284.1 hypothetical protein ASD17_02915 [Sphingomonas sp. Root1294]KQY68132.1 hypothetical protein ASD39_05435 [Sphingomonas sp. Root50]KRB91025.1 hypothetical protein ASE22_12230 [Sphingomonas sp. Root720]
MILPRLSSDPVRQRTSIGVLALAAVLMITATGAVLEPGHDATRQSASTSGSVAAAVGSALLRH